MTDIAIALHSRFERDKQSISSATRSATVVGKRASAVSECVSVEFWPSAVF